MNLALQGGGAHGAFTWGALDRLLEDDTLSFEALSGTSAGAINAVLLAAGLADGGPVAAREKLAKFWSAIATHPHGDAIASSLFIAFPGLQRVQQAGLDLMGKFLAPAQFNPLDYNPMRDLLRDLVDFERLRALGPALFVAATDAATGRKRIFTREEMNLEAVLASACLPQLHHPVEVDGRLYWDGGYVANPPLLPLVQDAKAADTLLIQLIPLADQDVPQDHAGIGEGLTRVIFNAPLRQEIATLQLLSEAQKPDSQVAGHRFHLIDATPTTQSLPPGSRLTPDRRLIEQLRDAGRQAADDWLARNRDQIGRQATADLAAAFL
ncbi:MAG TPA: patatin-like phospholipase family protein [Dongiaceae bacterium]|nr:patatin-like phospholipase family protein [Dongiaceae bacterium]